MTAPRIFTPLWRLSIVLPVLLLAACTNMLSPNGDVTVTQPGGGAGAAVVPEGTDPTDRDIGLREHPRIIAAYGGIYSDRKAEIMVARIVSRLLEAAGQPGEQFTVTILDSPEVNAFALPGGFVYVTRGILALANDTSELAAVLAHEIAHVTLRHARERTTRARTSEIVDRVITDVFNSDPNVDDASARSRMALAAFSQSQELAADREGVMISGRAGYDPHAAARFLADMGRFEAYTTGSTDDAAGFLSSHPSTPDRIEKAVESARSFFGAPGIGETDRAGYLTAIEGVTYGQSPQQGAIVGRQFVHPELQLTFTVPQGYQLQLAQNAVVGVAGDGEAVRFDSAEVPTTLALADYLNSGWIAGLDPATLRTETINGIETASGVANTDGWVFRVAVMRHDGDVYRFIFAVRTDSDRFSRGAAETLRSFRSATQQDLAQIRTLRVRLVTASATDTAASLAARMAPASGGGDLFYVLNNLFPGDRVEAGAQYKVVVVE